MSTLERNARGRAPAHQASRSLREGWTRLPVPWVVVGLGVLTFLVRLVYLRWPMTSDEGGYLQIVRQWTQGTSDYGDYFMDRPPVLVVWYQLVDLLSGVVGTMGAVRVVGSLAAMLTVIGTGLAARQAGGRRAGVVAAGTCAALLASPFMGAVATDGEILAAPFIAWGIWLALVAVAHLGTERSRRAAVLAGACAALALLVKQNMLDAAVFSGVLALVAWRTGRITWAQVRGLALQFSGGAAATAVLVLGYAALHGTSPAEVFYAMYTFRAQAADVLVQFTATYRWERLHDLVVRGLACGGLLVPVLAGVVGTRRLTGRTSKRLPAELAVLVLFVFVTVSVLAGGAFWDHYLVQYAVPMALTAGLLVASVPRLGWMLVAPCVAVSSIGWALGALWPDESDSVRIGQAVERVALPGDTMVSALGDPVITETAGLTSPYYQLWSLSARTMDPDLARLRDALAGTAAPTWVVVRGPETLALIRSTSAGPTLASRYHEVAQLCDRIVFLNDEAHRPAPRPPQTCLGSAGQGPSTAPYADLPQ